MKTVGTCVGFLVALSIGWTAFAFGTFYNKPVRNAEVEILQSLCKANEGMKYFRRDWIERNTFNVRCNDTAQFLDVTINLKDTTK